MKKIYILLGAVVCSFFFGCYGDDDANRYVSVEIQDALIFENNQNYIVGDTAYVELNFSRYLDEAGFPNKLDIFESSGSEAFRYSFNLIKLSELSGGFRRIDVSSEFLFAEKGTVGEFGGATAQLNDAQTEYQSRFGIILAEAGRFELDLQFLYISSNDYFQDKVQIEIQHRYTGDPPNFEFEVTE